MTRHPFQEIIDEKKKAFAETHKRSFSSAQFPTPESTPAHLLPEVMRLKILEAESRQLEILSEIRRLPKSGGTFVIPEEFIPLLEEFNRLKETVAIWSSSKKC